MEGVIVLILFAEPWRICSCKALNDGELLVVPSLLPIVGRQHKRRRSPQGARLTR